MLFGLGGGLYLLYPVSHNETWSCEMICEMIYAEEADSAFLSQTLDQNDAVGWIRVFRTKHVIGFSLPSC